MYNKETLNKWNMTEDECERAIKKITIKGMRLTHKEKEDMLYYFEEGLIARDDIDAQIKHIEFERKLAQKFEDDKKLVREFAKEVRRLERKYDGFDFEDKSLDELTEMWLDDYFELNFLEDHFERIKYHGAKEYAQYYLHVRGQIPESEVSMWA